ncbi:MAG: KOW domain-containing protein [Roseburia sp.]|nr:KOW domain-containing protein [Roseburia sp.]
MNIEFAKSMSGHDRNQIYLIKEKDEKFVYLVNGTTKTLAAPKKKSVKHIQIIRHLPAEVTDCLRKEMTDVTVKRAIKTYGIINQEEM